MYFVLLFYIQFPPPCNSGIISTTTIIITVAIELMLFIFLLSMKDVCYTNIHPLHLKNKTCKISFEDSFVLLSQYLKELFFQF